MNQPMHVFVLGTGRCGTMTFARACGHIANYTTAHESRTSCWGRDRLDYADRHIEVDNRLAWFLGELDERFGRDAFYVHLLRDSEKVVRSFLKKWGSGVIDAFTGTIVMQRDWQPSQRAAACRFYVETVNANLRQFLKDKPQQLTIDIERPLPGFEEFWKRIGAQGHYERAVVEFSVRHNASG
jgi:hypothetical protein